MSRNSCAEGLTQAEQTAISRLCLFCWGRTGDVFLRVPLIEAIGERFPHALIAVVMDPPAVKVLANHPACSRIVAFNRQRSLSSRYFRQAITIAWRLRRERFDVSVDLYGGGTSIYATRFVQARWRIAFGHTPALRAANNVLVPHPSFCQHWTRALAELLRPLGIDPDSVRRGTSYFCRPEARVEAERILRNYASAKLVAINLGGGDVRKRWGLENFVALAEILRSEYGATPVVYTNPGMEELTEAFAARFAGNYVRLPRLAFDVEAAVMERCHAVITGDSALMHLASGLKRPILGLFLVTRPEAVAPADCVFVPCYRENPRARDPCGRLSLDPELPVDLVAARYAELEQILAHDSHSAYR